MLPWEACNLLGLPQFSNNSQSVWLSDSTIISVTSRYSMQHVIKRAIHPQRVLHLGSRAFSLQSGWWARWRDRSWHRGHCGWLKWQWLRLWWPKRWSWYQHLQWIRFTSLPDWWSWLGPSVWSKLCKSSTSANSRAHVTWEANPKRFTRCWWSSCFHTEHQTWILRNFGKPSHSWRSGRMFEPS